MEGIVRKAPGGVAFAAFRPPRKQVEAAFGGLRNGGLIAGNPAVERRRCRHDGPLIGRQRPLDGRARHPFARKYLVEIGAIGRILRDVPEQLLLVTAHIGGAGKRREGDAFQRWKLAVPAKALHPSGSQHGRRAEWQRGAGLTDGTGQAIAPGQPRVMASRARNGPGSRHQGVEKQLPPEFGLFRRIGIFRGKWHGRRPRKFRHSNRAVALRRAQIPHWGNQHRQHDAQGNTQRYSRFAQPGESGPFPYCFEHVPQGPKYIVYYDRLEPGLNNMTDESPNSPMTRSFSLSIGQLTFGSFMLVLAVIIITSTASVIAIRHIDATFAELQRLQSVGDLAEDIDRRMNELRLAARDFVTDPGAQSSQVGGAAASLSEILKKTRLELAPEQQDMIDGVTARLSTYRNGIERISGLISRRADLVAGLSPLREQFDAAIAETPDPVIAATLFKTQSRIASALLAHDPSAAERAAQSMRVLTISNPRLRAAVDNYAEAIIAISIRERQIADIDREVLGSEGRLIGQVTELLREVSARRGHVLSRDFARTLTEAKWQSIILGTSGIFFGLFAALFVVRRTVRPLASIAASIRALAGGEKDTSSHSNDVHNEIGENAP